jgi:hypothetical protein
MCVGVSCRAFGGLLYTLNVLFRSVVVLTKVMWTIKQHKVGALQGTVWVFPSVHLLRLYRGLRKDLGIFGCRGHIQQPATTCAAALCWGYQPGAAFIACAAAAYVATRARQCSGKMSDDPSWCAGPVHVTCR